MKRESWWWRLRVRIAGRLLAAGQAMEDRWEQAAADRAEARRQAAAERWRAEEYRQHWGRRP